MLGTDWDETQLHSYLFHKRWYGTVNEMQIITSVLTLALAASSALAAPSGALEERQQGSITVLYYGGNNNCQSSPLANVTYTSNGSNCDIPIVNVPGITQFSVIQNSFDGPVGLLQRGGCQYKNPSGGVIVLNPRQTVTCFTQDVNSIDFGFRFS
ncbi:hypothetical protein HJFPF1_02210 [Paramyrothecium foliicola]|nr:hypothetical protein HJFPF1_02210 [Paramyrothecium foliicola]